MMTFPRIVARFAVVGGVCTAAVLIATGRFDYWPAWAWSAVIFTSAISIYGVLLRVNPGLVQERLAPPKGNDRDAATRRLVLLPLLGHLVLAGLDVRFGWSIVPLPLIITGLALVGLSFALVAWVLASNPFASSQVRIQGDRAQTVIMHGPYRIVRHPMYLAVVIIVLGSGPALGSWWAGLLLLPVLGIFVRRTAIEDRMLFDELPGYRAYAARVRWRIVPLVY